MQPKISPKKEILLAVIGVIAMLAIAWVINGPLTELRLQRIVREETRSLTRLPAASEAMIHFVDNSGKQITLKDFSGKPLVMNLWATWCPPCVAELPVLAGIQKRYGGRLQVIAISTDATGFAAIDAFLAKTPVEHPPFYHDKGGVLFKHLKLRGLPTTYIINTEGQTVAKLERAIYENDKELLELLDELVTPETQETPNPSSK